MMELEDIYVHCWLCGTPWLIDFMSIHQFAYGNSEQIIKGLGLDRDMERHIILPMLEDHLLCPSCTRSNRAIIWRDS